MYASERVDCLLSGAAASQSICICREIAIRMTRNATTLSLTSLTMYSFILFMFIGSDSNGSVCVCVYGAWRYTPPNDVTKTWLCLIHTPHRNAIIIIRDWGTRIVAGHRVRMDSSSAQILFRCIIKFIVFHCVGCDGKQISSPTENPASAKEVPFCCCVRGWPESGPISVRIGM